MAVIKYHTPCPICSRKLNTNKPQKGESVYDTIYCSKYCRIFDERKLEKIPYSSRNKYHKNKITWPSIEAPCQMCYKTLTLVHNLEKRNKSFCSTECWNRLNSCQKGIQRTMHILSILEYRRRYGESLWDSPSTISEIYGVHKIGCSPTTISSLLKRWRDAGIVEISMRGDRIQGYRFILDGLRGMTVSQFVYNWNTMTYAERVKF